MTEAGKITYLEFGVDGARLLSEIHRLSFEGAPERAWDERDFIDIYEVSGTLSYVIVIDEKPIGFTTIRTVIDEGEIITFCMLPKWCNYGYSTLLLEWVIKKLQLSSFKRLFLEVRENNEAAIRLYKKCAFEIIGRRKGYYNNQNMKLDALVMQRDINK